MTLVIGTVEVKDILTYLPINIANQPNTYNPFTGGVLQMRLKNLWKM